MAVQELKLAQWLILFLSQTYVFYCSSAELTQSHNNVSWEGGYQFIIGVQVCVCECVCETDRQTDRQCVCVCVCVCERERQTECVCVCVCVGGWGKDLNKTHNFDAQFHSLCVEINGILHVSFLILIQSFRQQEPRPLQVGLYNHHQHHHHHHYHFIISSEQT